MEAAFLGHDTTAHKQLRLEGWAQATLPGIVVFFGLLSVLTSPVWAMQIEYVEAKTIRLLGIVDSPEEWYATSYEIGNIDEVNNYCAQHSDDCKDEDGKQPAMKLCFWHDPAKKTQLCHRIEDIGPAGYAYHKTQSLKIELLCDNSCVNWAGVVLEGRNETPLAGWVGSLSCWVYDPKLRDFVNILPTVKFSDQGEYKFFRNLGNGIQGVFIEADEIADWLKEGRYGPHKFLISAYKQNAKGYYKKIGSYRTAGKYPSLDAILEVDVIIPELDKIKRFILLRQKK